MKLTDTTANALTTTSFLGAATAAAVQYLFGLGCIRLLPLQDLPIREKMKEIKERIFSNWKTTTLGIAVLICGFVLVWFEKATLSELTGFVAGGLLLLISRDK
jgi:hypothetical protein